MTAGVERIQQQSEAAVVAMREELGDVLLQRCFHARIAAERTPEDRWFDIDDVASCLNKLVRRHPHVFGGAIPLTPLTSRSGETR